MNVNVITELARQKIDAEIMELQERVRSLRSSRNALAPVHVLPPEVMTQIFKWVQLLYGGEVASNYEEAESLPKWIKVTHVSRHWRNIAFDSNSLYSTLITRNLEYSRGVLEHSEVAPLTLIDTAHYNTKMMWQTAQLQEFVLGVLPRIRKMWLMNYTAIEFLHPHLEKLVLPLEELYIRDSEFINTTFSPTSLRLLRLDWCLVPSYNWLSRLSNFKYHTPRPSHILDAMPRLDSLSFAAVLQTASGRIKRRSPVKPKLRYLEVADAPDALVELLPWLSFAPRFTCILNPGETHQPTSADWLTPLLNQIGRHLQSSSMVFRMAKLVQDDSGDDDIQTLLFERADEEPRFQIVLSELMCQGNILNYWWSSVAAIPLGNVEVMTIATSGGVDWSSSLWRGLQSLRQLVIENEHASLAFLDYLADDGKAKQGRRTSEETLPFSSLQELSLYGVKFNRELKAKVLAAFTGRMKNHGVKLHKLTFRDSNISDDTMKQVSKVVDVVEKLGEKRLVKKRST